MKIFCCPARKRSRMAHNQRQRPQWKDTPDAPYTPEWPLLAASAGVFTCSALIGKTREKLSSWRENRAGQHSSVAVTVLALFPQNVTFIEYSHTGRTVVFCSNRYAQRSGFFGFRDTVTRARMAMSAITERVSPCRSASRLISFLRVVTHAHLRPCVGLGAQLLHIGIAGSG